MYFKKFLSTVLSVSTILMAVTGSMTSSIICAANEDYPTSGTCGTNATWLINTDGVLVISGTGEMTKTEQGKYGKAWGWENVTNGITEIVVEEGITVPSSSVFNGTFAPNISKVSLPSSLTKFNGCFESYNVKLYTSLKDIYVYSKKLTDALTINSKFPYAGSGIIWHVYEDSDTEASLRNDLKLTDKDIEYIPDDEEMPTVENKTPAELAPVTETSGPAGVASKFEWASTSKTLTFSGKGAIIIDDYFYEKYKETTEQIIIESGITIIDAQVDGTGSGVTYGAFYEYKALKDIQLPDTLMLISDSTFYSTALEGELYLPDTLTYVGNYAFSNTNITSINSLNECMFIGGKAFYRCRLLKEVTIPKNVSLGNDYSPNGSGYSCGMFEGCIELEKVIIYDGMSGDDEPFRSMFSDCTSLKDVYLYITDLHSIKGPNDGIIEEWYMFSKDNNITFHIYKNSTTEDTLRKAGYLTDENLVELAYFTALESAIKDAEKKIADSSKYTDESVSALNEALENGRAVLNDLTSSQETVDEAVKAIKEAIKSLEEKKEPSSSETTSDEPSSDNSTEPTSKDPTTSPTNTPNVTTKPNNSVAQAKANAQKIMNQAKITKLKVKSKSKKKITVSWKKVNKAVGYEVQVAKNNKFKTKKIVFDKFTKKKKLIFKNKIKSGTAYYVRVRAYATYKDENGKARKVYSKWIKKTRKVKVK